MRVTNARWPQYVVCGMTAEQFDYLSTLADARREALKVKVFGRIGKRDRSAVLRSMVAMAMDGSLYVKGAELAMPTKAELLEVIEKPAVMVERSIADLYPQMVYDLPAADLPLAFERLHELLGECYRRARREQLRLDGGAPALAAPTAPRWIGGQA